MQEEGTAPWAAKEVSKGKKSNTEPTTWLSIGDVRLSQAPGKNMGQNTSINLSVKASEVLKNKQKSLIMTELNYY